MTRIRISLLAFVLALPMFVLAAAPVFAQAVESAKIVLVDFTRISEESLVGQDVKAQLEQYEMKVQTRQEELQSQLNQEGQELESQERVLPSDVFQERVNAYRQKAQQAELELQQKRQLLVRASQQAELEISRNLRPIIRDIMTQRGANIVLSKSGVYMDSGGFDITEQVIQRLNQVLTSYQVPLPSE